MLSTPVTVAIEGPCQTTSAREEVARPLRVVPVEDLGHEPPRDLDPLVDRERLAHAASPPSGRPGRPCCRGSSLAARGDRILESRSPSPSVVRPFGRCDGSDRRGYRACDGHEAVEPRLLGREREREVLERLLEGARAGHGGVLVLHGEPGVGKTALLEFAVEDGTGLPGRPHRRGRRGDGAPVRRAPAAVFTDHRADRAPARSPARRARRRVRTQRRAGARIRSSSGSRSSVCCRRRPRSARCSAWSTTRSGWTMRRLARLRSSRAGSSRRRSRSLFAARERGDALAGFPEINVGPLGRRDARALLESVLPARVDERVLERIVVETRGNPLALLELPRGMTPTQLAGGFGLPAALPAVRPDRGTLHATTRERPARCVGACCSSPRQTRRAISRSCLARRSGSRSPSRRRKRSDRTACSTSSAGVVFRHPLARSAVYRAATADERSEVHRALADATDPDVDPDRRAWHRAQATSMPDEDVAAELERSAARAQARGGFAAAAAFLERSSVLTLDPARRAARALAAAQAKHEAGAFDEALTLAANAEAGPLDGLQRAEVDLLRARISFAAERGNEAPRLLLTAAKGFEPFDARRAREIYLDALSAALFAGRLAGPCGAREVAAAARALPEPATPPAAADLLLDGLARMITEGPTTGTPAAARGVACLRERRHRSG